MFCIYNTCRLIGTFILGIAIKFYVIRIISEMVSSDGSFRCRGHVRRDLPGNCRSHFSVMTIYASNRVSIAFKAVPGSADKPYGLKKGQPEPSISIQPLEMN